MWLVRIANPPSDARPTEGSFPRCTHPCYQYLTPGAHIPLRFVALPLGDYPPPALQVHLETAAAAGIVPHLCAFAAQGCAAAAAARSSPTPPSPGPTTSTSSPASPPHPDPSALTPGSPEALAAAAAQWPAVRGAVVPLLRGLVGCSAASRAKLYACGGLDIFLHLLSDQVGAQAILVPYRFGVLSGWALHVNGLRVNHRHLLSDQVGRGRLYQGGFAARPPTRMLVGALSVRAHAVVPAPSVRPGVQLPLWRRAQKCS